MAEECENLPRCSFFNEFRGNSDVIRNGWVALYCRDKGKSVTCRRKQLRATGQSPPPNMTPTGTLLPGARDG